MKGIGAYEDHPEDHLSLVKLDSLLEKIYDYSMELFTEQVNKVKEKD